MNKCAAAAIEHHHPLRRLTARCHCPVQWRIARYCVIQCQAPAGRDRNGIPARRHSLENASQRPIGQRPSTNGLRIIARQQQIRLWLQTGFHDPVVMGADD